MIDVQIGDKVVCIDVGPRGPLQYTAPTLRVGRVYTVTKVMVAAPGYVDAGSVGFCLAEAEPSSPQQAGFAADRFRKVQKADDGFIQHMRMMRPKAPSRQREDA